MVVCPLKKFLMGPIRDHEDVLTAELGMDEEVRTVYFETQSSWSTLSASRGHPAYRRSTAGVISNESPSLTRPPLSLSTHRGWR